MTVSAFDQSLRKQTEKAVKALLKFEAESAEKQTSSNLLDDAVDEEGHSKTPLWLVVGLEKVPEAKKIKPITLSVAFPWKDANDGLLSVCLISKDPHAEIKERVKATGLQSVSKVMGVSKLKSSYKAFETRRQLCQSFDVFLADERVLPLLPKLLGKVFFEKKKIPLPVNLQKASKDALSKELKMAIEGTALHLNSGPCTSIKVGLANQSSKDLTENIASVVEQAVKKIPGGWNNIRSIHLKTATSVSLPIYVPSEN